MVILSGGLSLLILLMPSRTPENVRIEKRKSILKFAESDEVINWSSKSIAEQVFLDNFSCYLPLGERFFVDSVRHFEKRVTSEKLKEEVKNFIYQEAQHSISHQNFNSALYSRNKLAPVSELYLCALLSIARIIYSKRFQLSFTAAAEHFTAIISNWLLSTEDAFLRKNSPAVASMWVWHAIEEIEHKSVAFDVFMEVTPNRYYAYFLRVMGMIILSVSLFPAMVINMPIIYLGGRYYQLTNSRAHKNIVKSQITGGHDTHIQSYEIPKESFESDPASQKRDSSVWYLTRLLRKIAWPYLQYYKFSFHPWQQNNSSLLNEVKSKFNFDVVVKRQDTVTMEVSSLAGSGS